MSDLNSALNSLRSQYGLDIEAPFVLSIESQRHEFQCLIRGYGAKYGMVVDSDWSKLAPIANKLAKLGYGYSCLEIAGDGAAEFKEVLDDWGKASA